MKKRQRTLRYIISVLVLIAVWKIAALLIDSPVLPQPEAAFMALVKIAITPEFWLHFRESAFRVTVSIAISLVIAFPIGIILGYNAKIDSIISPMLFITYPIPKIVFLPVILVLFGIGNFSKIVLITLIVAYQLLIIVRDGVSNINKKHVETVKSLGGSHLHVLFHVLVPASLPYLFTALRLTTGTAITVLFIAETYATRTGLGYYIMDSWSRAAYDHMFVGIIGMAALGIIFYALFSSLEKIFCHWKMLERIKTEFNEISV